MASNFISSSAQAYSAWVLSGSQLRKDRPAHIAVVGYSHGMANQFLQAATARMLRYQEMYPDHTVVVFQPRVEVFEVRGLEKVFENNEELLGETLVKEILTFSDVRNLDFFAHSSAHQGIGLELGSVNMPEQSFYAVTPDNNPVRKYRKGTPDLKKLKRVLHPNAWITINGCNSAWIQAPALSNILERPVLAAATGTDFQRLFEDGNYYFNNQGQFPTSGAWASINNMAYASEKACRNGACLRMKPQEAPYKGYWGDYRNVGTLGYYKFFCNYSGFENNCYKTMARYLQTVLSKNSLNLSSSRAEYMDTIYDMLCPINPMTKQRRDACIDTINQKLLSGDESYNPFPGTQADCSLRGCKIRELRCSYYINGSGIPGTCVFTADPNARGETTLIREVKNYLRGLDELGIH